MYFVPYYCHFPSFFFCSYCLLQTLSIIFAGYFCKLHLSLTAYGHVIYMTDLLIHITKKKQKISIQFDLRIQNTTFIYIVIVKILLYTLDFTINLLYLATATIN